MSTIIMLVLMVVAFYFLLIRPQKKRQQEAVKMQNSLAPGTRIMTTTGLFATVVAIDHEDVILEIAPGVETRWVKAAIGRVVTPVDAPVDSTDEVDDDVKATVDGDVPVKNDTDQDQSTPKS
ncbi:preprotein translocase subunit YajC [Nonomuraea soli]|uniref:Preprotein translocase subunit YajC n=1 Tax=Nonomuraea soli TaxID=1032476 RepID=A0A7W0CPT8_9ACTN|nr:preprotein translocase subunit YajC [Nonomuraea soli]MBA2895144.1 preprotein translocase subunit YajC [Nonomuraea soli]